MPSGVYKIACRTDSTDYIGSSIDIDRRWDGHKRQLNNNNHPNKKLQKAWSLYGSEAFSLSVLEEVSIEKLAERETHYLRSEKPRLNNRLVSGRGDTKEGRAVNLDERRTTSVRLSEVTLELLEKASHHYQRSQSSIIEEALLDWIKKHNFAKRYQLEEKNDYIILTEIDIDHVVIKDVQQRNGVPVEEIARKYSEKLNAPVKVIQG